MRLSRMLLGPALGLALAPAAHAATQLGDYAGDTGVSADRDTPRRESRLHSGRRPAAAGNDR